MLGEYHKPSSLTHLCMHVQVLEVILNRGGGGGGGGLRERECSSSESSWLGVTRTFTSCSCVFAFMLLFWRQYTVHVWITCTLYRPGRSNRDGA